MPGNSRRLTVVMAALSMLTFGSVRASAGLESLNLAGTFAAGSKLDSDPAFASATAFSMTAVFDPSTIFSGVGEDAPAALTITVSGYGTYAVSDTVYALFEDPTVTGSYYAAGIFNGSVGGAFYGIFGTATPAFSAASPTPSVLSSFTATADSLLGFDLSGGGTLLIAGFPGTLSASITAVAAPEPASLFLLSGALAGLLFARRREAA